jgi:parafibromin
MSTTDPLDALRAAITAKYDIIPVDASGAPAGSLRTATHLRLSTETTLPKNAPTRLRKAGGNATGPASHPDGFFMLEAVYLAWLLRDTSGGDYMKQARDHGLPAGGFVSLTERKSIVDWLKRTVTSLGNIVPLSGVSFSTAMSPVPPNPNALRVNHAPRIPTPFRLSPPACPVFYHTFTGVILRIHSFPWRCRDDHITY